MESDDVICDQILATPVKWLDSGAAISEKRRSQLGTAIHARLVADIYCGGAIHDITGCDDFLTSDSESRGWVDKHCYEEQLRLLQGEVTILEAKVRDTEATKDPLRALCSVIAEIESRASEILEPCDGLQFQLHADPEDASIVTFLILVPVAHSAADSASRMDKFEDWWFERKRQIHARVVVDLVQRL